MDFDTSSFGNDHIVSFDEIKLLSYNGATSDSYKVRLWGKWFFMKRPKAQFADNPKYIAAFEKEFDLGFHLDHPNIVRYHSYGEDASGPYILEHEMEISMSRHAEMMSKYRKKMLRISSGAFSLRSRG